MTAMVEPGRIYFQHFKLPCGGRATVAVLMEPFGGCVRAGVAWCRAGDQFSRRMGRTIAGGRLRRERSSLKFILPKADGTTVDSLIACAVHTINTSARRAGRLGGIPVEKQP